MTQWNVPTFGGATIVDELIQYQDMMLQNHTQGARASLTHKTEQSMTVRLILLCGPGWPGTLYVDQASLELRDLLRLLPLFPLCWD